MGYQKSHKKVFQINTKPSKRPWPFKKFGRFNFNPPPWRWKYFSKNLVVNLKKIYRRIK